MGFYVSTQNTAFAATISTFLKNITGELAAVDQRIATNKRVSTMRDDPIAYIKSERLMGDAATLRSVIKDDLERAIGIFEVATSTMDQLRDFYEDLEALALDSASGSPSQPRAALDALFEQTKTEMTTLINGAFYDGVQVLSGVYDSSRGGTDLSVLFNISATQQLTESVYLVSLNTLGVNALDISTQANAQAAYNSLTNSGIAGTAGYYLELFDFALNASLETLQQYRDYAAVQASNYEAAASGMTEADAAFEVARQTALQIQQQAAISVLAQANLRQTYVLNLFPNLTNWG